MSDKHHKKASETVEHKAPPGAAPILPVKDEGKPAPEETPAPSPHHPVPRPRRERVQE